MKIEADKKKLDVEEQGVNHSLRLYVFSRGKKLYLLYVS